MDPNLLNYISNRLMQEIVNTKDMNESRQLLFQQMSVNGFDNNKFLEVFNVVTSYIDLEINSIRMPNINDIVENTVKEIVTSLAAIASLNTFRQNIPVHLVPEVQKLANIYLGIVKAIQSNTNYNNTNSNNSPRPWNSFISSGPNSKSYVASRYSDNEPKQNKQNWRNDKYDKNEATNEVTRVPNRYQQVILEGEDTMNKEEHKLFFSEADNNRSRDEFMPRPRQFNQKPFEDMTTDEIAEEMANNIVSQVSSKPKFKDNRFLNSNLLSCSDNIIFTDSLEATIIEKYIEFHKDNIEDDMLKMYKCISIKDFPLGIVPNAEYLKVILEKFISYYVDKISKSDMLEFIVSNPQYKALITYIDRRFTNHLNCRFRNYEPNRKFAIDSFISDAEDLHKLFLNPDKIMYKEIYNTAGTYLLNVLSTFDLYREDIDKLRSEKTHVYCESYQLIFTGYDKSDLLLNSDRGRRCVIENMGPVDDRVYNGISGDIFHALSSYYRLDDKMKTSYNRAFLIGKDFSIVEFMYFNNTVLTVAVD